MNADDMLAEMERVERIKDYLSQVFKADVTVQVAWNGESWEQLYRKGLLARMRAEAKVIAHDREIELERIRAARSEKDERKKNTRHRDRQARLRRDKRNIQHPVQAEGGPTGLFD